LNASRVLLLSFAIAFLAVPAFPDTSTRDTKPIGDDTLETPKNLGSENVSPGFANKEDREALERYRKAAELGDTGAQTVLGRIYANGMGVAKDDTKAAQWYRVAAEKGVPEAQTALGWMYLNGKGVDKDEAEALRWYRKAADQGSAPAQYMLAWMLENARGTAQDDIEADHWYLKAAEREFALPRLLWG
jgi:TPR repeat protein